MCRRRCGHSGRLAALLVCFLVLALTLFDGERRRLGCLGQITEEEGQGQGQGQGQEGGRSSAVGASAGAARPPLGGAMPAPEGLELLVGFGSIIQTDSRRASDPSATDAAPCRISADFGYVRSGIFRRE